MKLNNIHGFDTIQAFVSWKLERFAKEGMDFYTIFKLMFNEENNTMVESSDGYSIQCCSYGQCKEMVLSDASWLKDVLSLPQGSLVGLCMENSMLWIRAFWSLLLCGYCPVLINLGLPQETIQKQLESNGVQAVIGDGCKYPCSLAYAPKEGLDTGDTLPEAKQWGDRVYFMSSGSSGVVKLCGYGAEEFYYQLLNSLYILRKNPHFAAHYQGELKHLVLLPFYHIFGFIAVYLWYGFFSRTFVFPKDLSPQTIQSTIKKHKITHIFAVPMVWDTVRKTALRIIRGKGEGIYAKFQKALKLATANTTNNRFLHRSMGQVRSALFGESICCLISGGCALSRDTLRFFNGIGYWLVNGFGMTETGITGVDMSNRIQDRCLGSVGEPLPYTEYSINAEGELLIRGKSVAACILIEGQLQKRGAENWINSHDRVEVKNKLYYINGRSDDLLISPSGENLNPVLIEKSISLPGTDGVVLLSLKEEITLLISDSSCYSLERAQALLLAAQKELERLGLHKEIKSILMTPEELFTDDFKLNRKKIAKRCMDGSLCCMDGKNTHLGLQQVLNRLEQRVREQIAAALDTDPEKVGMEDDFFTDLNGSSLEYLILADNLFRQFGVDIKTVQGVSLHKASDICRFIGSIQ